MITRISAVLSLCIGFSLACQADGDFTSSNAAVAKGTTNSLTIAAGCVDRGDYRAEAASVSTSSSTEETYGLYFETSRYIRPLEMVWMPANTSVGAIEDQAHVVNYRTSNGKHTCELWWMGGDGGVPILSYLVDSTGAHYLPELSQPDADGAKPFQTVEEAKTKFASLAKKFYAAADAAVEYFSSIQFSNFSETSLPRGGRIDARVGQAGRDGVPEQVLDAFDFYYRVENADWGSVSLHKGTVGGQKIYAVYTTTDGDDAWLEVFSKNGTPLVSARLYAEQILGWDEVIGRTRMTTGLENLWQYAMTEGYSEADAAAAAGQILPDWTPAVVLNSGTLETEAYSKLLTKVTLSNASELSVAQTRLAYSAFEILWTRVLRMRVLDVYQLPLGSNGHSLGVLRLGTFVNPLNNKNYYIADWKDIDDASYTLYFERKDNYWERKDDQYKLAIQQYNN